MKKLLFLLIFIIAFSCSNKKEVKQVVAISCGQCKFDLNTEKGCSLAVRINNQAYFVEGFAIDDFGDAHDEHTGFCNVIRKAEVVGELVNDKFIANSIKLVE
jgi:hypothetical protein